MKLILLISACFFANIVAKNDCTLGKKSLNSKLICYYGDVEDVDGCYCTHVILPPNVDVKSIGKMRQASRGAKIYVTVHEFNQGLIDILKSNKIDGLEISLKKLDSKNDISDFISTVKTKIGTDLDIAVSVPSKSDLVAKYFDFKALSKYADLFILQTAFLGASANVTFHPSRLSGMWDMQNTDSVVDLISGLGAPLSKIVIAAPVQGFQFTLQSEEYTAPGSPALELKSITRDELCKLMQSGKNWTLERDEDQAGPYIFRKNQWLAFEDVKSMDIKAKYSRVRGLAGIALKDLAQDGGAGCGTTILEATYNGLSRQARAPRGAVLHSLEREILESPSKSLDSVQLSPYRISRIIDTEGKIHVTRQDSRTEFQCSRQGYFVHPRSCNRFYRCVKFDQRSEEFNVFEFDCPAGLAFDERVEVCVWPGSLPHGTPCSGSSEIAPVPRKRFECPSEPGYYADPENCRWFFACLDHGKSPLSAYEFRCPFGLGFDSERLVCEWPWLVPKCAGSFGSSLDSEYYYGGASGYAGKGGLSTGLVLQSYDGLGTLGSVKLGGVSGKIEKPIATVFSNVDTGALGLGYQNNGGYIVGGGLSYKAVQSLGNAGLLKVNNGAGYQATGQDQQGFTNIQQTGSFLAGQQAGQSVSQYSEHGADSSSYSFNSNANHNYGQVSSTHSAETSDNSQFQEIKSGYAQASGQQYNSQYQGNQEAAGAVSTQSFTLHHGHQTRDKSQGQNVNAIDGAEQNFFVANGAQENNGYIASNGHIDHESDHGGSYVYQSSSGYGETGHSNQQQGELVVSTGHGDQSSSGAISSHSFAQYGGERQLGGSYQYNSDNGEGYQGDSGSYVNGKTDFSSDQTNVDSKYEGNYQGSTGGTVSSQSFTQYHGKQALSGATYKSGIGGNINIVGGGYSAVGAVNGVDVSNNGDAEDIKTVSYTSTASPVSVITYAPISTGSSVPTVQAVPVPGIKTGGAFETYKGGVIANVPELQYNIQSHGDTGFLANISSRFANFVVTTPETVSQSYSQEGGYVYNKPEQEGSINTVSTAGPFVSVTTQRPQVYFSSSVGPTDAPVSFSTVRPIQSTVTYEKSQNFEQNVGGAVVNTFSTISTANPPKFVSHQQPLIYMSSTPAPPAVSSYSFTQDVGQQQGGYYYNKPDVEYEEGPKNPTIVSKFTIRRPSAHTVNTGSYYYERPTAHIKQNTLVESYAYQQPTVVPQYHYQQPPLEQKPIVPLYKQPQLLSTYTYQPPVRKTAYKQPVSVYTYQNVAQQSLGLNQEKNQVTLVRKPVQKNSYRPSGGTSYQYVKFENDVRGKTAAVQREGYKYPQPTIAFEEVPQKDVLLVLSTPKPNLVIQEIKAQQGYIYQQPAVNIQETYGEYSTPKSVVPVQPAVVTSYFNSGVKSAAGQNNEFKYSNQEENKSQEGYVYENKAVYSSTAKPTVNAQPAVVTSYFNTGSTNFKAESAAQQQNEYEFSRQEESKGQNGYVYENTAVYSTAKPVVNAQPAVVTSYFNTGSTNFKAESAAQQQNEYEFSRQEESKGQNGYVYENTAVYSTAKPVVNAQPAVVTSYFNTGSTNFKAESAAQQQNEYEFSRQEESKGQNGYVYENNAVYSTAKPTVNAQPAVVTSYFNTGSTNFKAESAAQQQNEYEFSRQEENKGQNGYVYENTAVYSTAKPVVNARPAVVTSYFNTGSTNFKAESEAQQQNEYEFSRQEESKGQNGYVYENNAVYSTAKPTVNAQPAVVTSYFNTGSTNFKAESAAQQQNEYEFSRQEESKGQNEYVYENTAVYSTAKPVVNAQPAVVTSYFNTGSTNFKAEFAAQQQNEYEFSRQEESKGQNGYVYENTAVYSTAKPVVNAQPAVVTSYFNTGSTNFKAESAAQQHSEFKFSNQEENNVQQGYVFENPTAKPIENAQPAVVTSYFNLGSTKSQEQAAVDQYKVGYSYPKPSIKFEEAPVTYRTPAVVTNYFNIQSSTPKPDVYAEEEITLSTRKPVSVGYTYPKPQIRFEETSQADILREEQGHVHYTPQTEVAEEPRPAVVTSYFRPKSSNSPSAKGYDYPKPSIQFAEEPQSFVGGYEHQEPVEEEPFVKKTAYITGEYEQNARKNYNYQKTASGSGRVVEDYVYPNYEKVKQAVFGQKLGYEQQQVNYQQSTPRPTFVSTVKSIVAEKTNQISPAVVTFYDSRLTSTPESYIVSSTASPEIHTVSTSRPISRFSFSSADDQNQYNQNFDIIRSTTYESTKKYLSPTSRVRVTTALPKLTRTKVVEDYVAPEVTTLARDYLPSRIRTKAPPREYLPVEVTTPSRAYIPSRQRVRVTSSTAAPEVTTLEREYLPVEITTPSRAYIPSRQRVRVTSSTAAPEVTSLEREYLPVEITTPSRAYIPSRQRVRVTTTTGAPEITTLEREYLPVKITSTDSSYIIKKPAAVRVGRPVKVIKQNDAHPLLSAKLGAQCTCVSNTLKLRKNQRIIIVEDEENNDDDDGYIIDNENQGKVIENYKYEPQKVVDITPVPDYYVKSTSVVPQSYIRRRVKVRPVQPVTEAVEIFYNKNTSPAAFQDESAPSDREIAKAVRTGLKLVKQAAKEGAQEALSGRQFDRYGPGGVRSKSETLQGTIDCQRAGLFRHPTECNKFYACRWDCTKNRFTLHVFNCPVHLTFDNNLGACNWPSQGPACIENTLITSD